MIKKKKSIYNPTIQIVSEAPLAEDGLFVLLDTFPYEQFAIEISIDGADAGDGSFQIQDSEQPDESVISESDFIDIDGVVLVADAGSSIIKFRIHGLSTRNLGIKYTKGSNTEGTVSIRITTDYQR